MQRDIKFRAFSTIGKHRMIYLKNGSLKDLQETDNWNVMQFTGLQDNNKIDIYEKDIFECVFKDCLDGYSIIGRETTVILVPAIVVFKFGGFCVEFMHPEKKELCYSTLHNFLKNPEKVVLGNTFENVNLLQGVS
jgi:uncharacterized phage protein (TIGR01671 family)